MRAMMTPWLLLALAWGGQASAEVQPRCETRVAPEVRVLVVGNSYSTDHRLSSRLQHVLNASGCFGSSVVVAVTRHGARLRELDLARLPALEPWDHVFLQDHSRAYMEGATRAALAVARIQAALRRETRVRVNLVETWADAAASPAVRSRIVTHHIETAERAGVPLVRVGQAFEAMAQAHDSAAEDGVRWFASDGRHASVAGASLYACVLAREVMGAAPPTLDLAQCVNWLMADFSASAHTSR
ncbi:hypothetical protein GTZ97_08205 [Aquabacterium fontiphilum]|uniref:SGNH/GDSL hydrolase family protein n=1 Tax=Aquabacterium fontiphilum TaxID=450365 RepID=UPI001378E42F|nr:SGNH/GDSL hydrolase family protein [Aquabacterium fontiphilum]NBD20648.1 hypothetical protein [Aquabacterium fontiphilum]